MINYLRKNIRNLIPYKTARDEYFGNIDCRLDANENPFENGYNRYPDPYQRELKAKISKMKNIEPSKIFIGNGSDEPIDILIKMFCDPRRDNIVTIAPSYGMYRVAADINDIDVVEVPLEKDFELNAEKLLAKTTISSKIIFLCSPNNPSGNLLNRSEIEKIIKRFRGVIVIDEAYIDFAEDRGFLADLELYKNVVILYTLSKAWGMAGLRLGFAFADETIISYMNRVKYPYNIGGYTQAIVLKKLSENIDEQIQYIVGERKRVFEILKSCQSVEKCYISDANFILVKFVDAAATYQKLLQAQIIVRNRSTQINCENCLRITIGTKEENDKLISILSI